MNHTEQKKFSNLSEHWWDLKGPMKPLHAMNQIRLEFIERYIQTSSQILDVGCGGGILTHALGEKGHCCTGIDTSGALIQTAKAKSAQLNHVTYQCCPIDKHTSQHYYDAVTCLELFEHISDPQKMISDCIQHLRPGGYFFISTINRNIKSYLCAIIGAEHLLQVLPKGTHKYQDFIKPCELERWIRRSGMKTLDISGISYNPVSNQAKLSQDLTINYILVCQKPEA